MEGYKLVAALVLAGFAILVGILVAQVTAGEVAWARLAWIFSGVEAIAFAAAGALFGSSVQRRHTEDAEARAIKAEDMREEDVEMASRGKALAAAVGGMGGLFEGEESWGASDEGPQDGVTYRQQMVQLKAVASALFPGE